MANVCFLASAIQDRTVRFPPTAAGRTPIEALPGSRPRDRLEAAALEELEPQANDLLGVEEAIFTRSGRDDGNWSKTDFRRLIFLSWG